MNAEEKRATLAKLVDIAMGVPHQDWHPDAEAAYLFEQFRAVLFPELSKGEKKTSNSSSHEMAPLIGARVLAAVRQLQSAAIAGAGCRMPPARVAALQYSGIIDHLLTLVGTKAEVDRSRPALAEAPHGRISMFTIIRNAPPPPEPKQ